MRGATRGSRSTGGTDRRSAWGTRESHTHTHTHTHTQHNTHTYTKVVSVVRVPPRVKRQCTRARTLPRGIVHACVVFTSVARLLVMTRGSRRRVRISTSIYPVPSICRGDQISDWFDTLVGCLHWNQRKPQQPFDHSFRERPSPEYNSDNSYYSNGNSTE